MYATLKLPLNFWTCRKKNACNQNHRPESVLLPPPFLPTLGLNFLCSADLLANLSFAVMGGWIRPPKSNTPQLWKRLELDPSWGTVFLTINYLSSKVVSTPWLFLSFFVSFEFATFHLQYWQPTWVSFNKPRAPSKRKSEETVSWIVSPFSKILVLHDFSELVTCIETVVGDLFVVMQWRWLNGLKTHYWNILSCELNPENGPKSLAAKWNEMQTPVLVVCSPYITREES